MEIRVTMPMALKAETVKLAIEGNLNKNSNHTCTVTFIGVEDNERVYTIEADKPEAFYLIGITAASLMSRIS